VRADPCPQVSLQTADVSDPGAVDVAVVVESCGRSSQGLVTAAGLRRAGVAPSTLSAARAAGEVVRPRRGVYATAPLPLWPRFVMSAEGPSPAYVAQVRAILLSLGPRAAACGRTAVVLWQWGLLVEPTRTVEAAVPHGRSHVAMPGVRVEQRRALERVRVRTLPGTDPLPVTSAVQTVLDCCRRLSIVEAVVVVDSALREGAVELSELVRAADRLQGLDGARRVRRALALCDSAAGSVLETVLRVRLVLAGVTGFETQRTVVDQDGRHVLRTDFCFPAARLVIEVDGARWHHDRQRDRSIDNALARLGWRVLRYGWAEVVHQHESVVADVRDALAHQAAA
jgi:very-short-patch-repair endonuclease